ncbi:MAG: DUF2959 domain-containing protein [bacterium]
MLKKIVLTGLLFALIGGCSSAYYSSMEKVGIHKRDIMVSRVEAARDSQQEAQEQFKSALDQFSSVVKVDESNLKKAYETLNDEYEASKDAAEDVSSRIRKVEAVSEALFKEWAQEIKEYQNPGFKRSSQKQLKETKARYKTMLATMKKAEASMQPVLRTFHDNVLFLKHNLNAQAIGALRSEFAGLSRNIDTLIASMNKSIASSNQFIAGMTPP